MKITKKEERKKEDIKKLKTNKNKFFIKSKNDTKGITLIALVITIIVLLILAGVTIAMLTGENGILTKASDAKSGNTIGKEKEEIGLAYSAKKAEKLEKGDTTPVKEAELSVSLANDKVNATAKGDNPIIVEFKDTKNKYKVDNNGNIEETKNEEEIEKVESTSSLWKFDVATQTIQEYLGTDIATITEITVPNYIDGVQVKKTHNEPIFGYDDGSKAINLEKVVVSEGIESIGDVTFMEIPKLKTVILKKGLKRIEDSYVFAINPNLTEVILPEGLEYIGESAFYLSGIKDIVLPASVKTLKGQSFRTNSYDKLQITALGNGDGTYFINRGSYDQEPFPCGTIRFVNNDVVGWTLYNDVTIGYFKLDKIKKEAYAFDIGYQSNSGINIIPSEIDGCKVVKLGKNMGFQRQLEIPNTVKLIEKGAIEDYATLFFVGYNSLEELKELKIEEGAIDKISYVLVMDKEIKLSDFLSYCTIIPSTN